MPHPESGKRFAFDRPGNYRVRVNVDSAATLGGLSGANTVLRVDVRLTHTTQVDFTLSGYRTQY